MPLIKSASPKARKENIKREIDAGKPVKQAVAISYSVQRRAAESGEKRPSLDRGEVGKWVRGERKDYK